jgi:type IV secretory pathway TrbD component
MEGTPVIKELNKLRIIPLIGLAPVVAILGSGVSVVLGALYSWLAGFVLFASIICIARWMNKVDIKFVELWFLSLSTGTLSTYHYDPALLEDASEFPEAY